MMPNGGARLSDSHTVQRTPPQKDGQAFNRALVASEYGTVGEMILEGPVAHTAFQHGFPQDSRIPERLGRCDVAAAGDSRDGEVGVVDLRRVGAVADPALSVERGGGLDAAPDQVVKVLEDARRQRLSPGFA